MNIFNSSGFVYFIIVVLVYKVLPTHALVTVSLYTRSKQQGK